MSHGDKKGDNMSLTGRKHVALALHGVLEVDPYETAKCSRQRIRRVDPGLVFSIGLVRLEQIRKGQEQVAVFEAEVVVAIAGQRNDDIGYARQLRDEPRPGLRLSQ